MSDVAAMSGETAPARRPTVWIGRVLTALVTLFLVVDGAVGLFMPERLEADLASTGFAAWSLLPIGALAIGCAVLHAIPATAVLGAIMTTGFLGGAICTHFRIGEVGSPPQIVSVLVGVAAWGGLYLRDPRVRALLPFRT